MILGIGNDLLDIRRFEEVMKRHEARFIARTFTAAEQKLAEQRRPGGTHIATYAKRFAAKEACAKALGTGFSGGIQMSDISIEHSENGAPHIILSGAAQERLDALVPADHTPVIHLSLSDDPPYVQAFVIIEARSV